MAREKQFKYQVINVKLQTNKKGVERTTAYKKLIKDLADNHIHLPIAKDKHMIIYSCMQNITANGSEYMYGNFGKGIFFDNEVVDNLRINNAEVQAEKPDPDLIQNAQITRYIFIPAIHRFIIIMDKTINAPQTFKFLKKALAIVADKEDVIEIEIVKDPQISKNILNAYALHSLNYTITYTNDDAEGVISKLYDRRLKKLQVGKANVSLQADHNGFLNKDERDELIEGGVELAVENGTINEAIITPEKGHKKMKLKNENRYRRLDRTHYSVLPSRFGSF